MGVTSGLESSTQAWPSVFNIGNCAIGAGILSFPYAVQRSGAACTLGKHRQYQLASSVCRVNIVAVSSTSAIASVEVQTNFALQVCTLCSRTRP